MLLGKRKDTGSWQVLDSVQSPFEVRPDGAWGTLLYISYSGCVREYEPARPKWEEVKHA